MRRLVTYQIPPQNDLMFSKVCCPKAIVPAISGHFGQVCLSLCNNMEPLQHNFPIPLTKLTDTTKSTHPDTLHGISKFGQKLACKKLPLQAWKYDTST